MRELEDTELEQGREILVAASGNTKTVAERLRIYTRKRTLKSWNGQKWVTRMAGKALPYSK